MINPSRQSSHQQTMTMHISKQAVLFTFGIWMLLNAMPADAEDSYGHWVRTVTYTVSDVLVQVPSGLGTNDKVEMSDDNSVGSQTVKCLATIKSNIDADAEIKSTGLSDFKFQWVNDCTGIPPVVSPLALTTNVHVDAKSIAESTLQVPDPAPFGLAHVQAELTCSGDILITGKHSSVKRTSIAAHAQGSVSDDAEDDFSPSIDVWGDGHVKLEKTGRAGATVPQFGVGGGTTHCTMTPP